MNRRFLNATAACLALVAATGTAAAQQFEHKEISADGAEFSVVRTGSDLTVVPRTILLGAASGEAVSFILQRGMGIGVEPPYFLNANLTYRFDTASEKLKEALASIKVAGADKVATQQLFRYRASLAYWDAAAGAYRMKPLDSGTSNTSSTFVSAFELRFESKDELQDFFAQPNNLKLLVELEIELQIPFPQGTTNVAGLVDQYTQSDFPEIAFPLAKKLVQIEAAHGVVVQPYLEAVVRLLSGKLSGYQLAVGRSGEAEYRLPDNASPPPGDEIALPPRVVKMIDRLINQRGIDICGDGSQLLLIDTGAIGCESLDDYLEME